MNNPFADLEQKAAPNENAPERKLLEEQKRQRRDEIYQTYTPMIYEVLDLLIAAYRPGQWKKDSDCSHAYLCHCNWYAGPEEPHKASYDEHHDIRRAVEISLEQDGACNPTGFKIMNHESMNKCLHVGLSRDELVRGIRAVLA